MAKPMYVRFEMPKDLVDKTYQSIELAKESGKVRKGTNEVTKLVERGEAQFVVMAEDVQPEEILAHMPLLCEEKGVPYAYVPSKQELGVAVGLGKATASIAILDPGKAKPVLDDLSGKLRAMKKARGLRGTRRHEGRRGQHPRGSGRGRRPDGDDRRSGPGESPRPRWTRQGSHHHAQREGEHPGRRRPHAPRDGAGSAQALGPVRRCPPDGPAPSAATRSSPGRARCSSARTGPSSCSARTSANRTCCTWVGFRGGPRGHRRSDGPPVGRSRRRRSSPRRPRSPWSRASRR